MCYGQTGAGKTFTLANETAGQQGIMVQTFNLIFQVSRPTDHIHVLATCALCAHCVFTTPTTTHSPCTHHALTMGSPCARYLLTQTAAEDKNAKYEVWAPSQPATQPATHPATQLGIAASVASVASVAASASADVASVADVASTALLASTAQVNVAYVQIYLDGLSDLLNPEGLGMPHAEGLHPGLAGRAPGRPASRPQAGLVRHAATHTPEPRL